MKMTFTLLITNLLQIWILAASADKLLKTQALQNDRVVLTCTANPKPGVEYRAVRWYKEGLSPRLTGLLSKELPDGRMRWYVGASTQNSVLNHTLNLLIPNVSCSHTGVYQCYLSAPVGEQNREGRVRLTVTDCPIDYDYLEELEKAVEKEAEKFAQMEKIPVNPAPQTEGYLLVFVAVGALFAAFIVFIVSYRSLTNMLWTKNKTPGKELFTYPNSPPEKQGLMPIFTSHPSPKNLPAFTV